MMDAPKAPAKQRQFEQDPAKAKSRQWMKQKILDTFHDPKQRQGIKAVFLTGPSLIEYEQIYRPAGLDPRNVYGIERDPEAFRFAKEANDARQESERINLINSTDCDFFSSSQSRYDIISLDFLQNYGPDIICSLDTIFSPKGRIISDQSLLFINSQAAREHPKYQFRLALFMAFFPSLIQFDCLLGSMFANRECYNELRSIQEADPRTDTLHYLIKLYNISCQNGSVPKIKSGLQWARMGILGEVYIRTELASLRNLEESDVSRALEKYKSRLFIHKPYNETLERLVNEALMLFSTADGSFTDSFRLAALGLLMPEVLYSALSLRHKSRINPDFPPALHGFIHAKLESLSMQSHETVSYTSQSRTSMLMHAFSFSRSIWDNLDQAGLNHRTIEYLGRMQAAQYDFSHNKDRQHEQLRLAAEKIFGPNPTIFHLIKSPKSFADFRAAKDIFRKIKNPSTVFSKEMLGLYKAFLNACNRNSKFMSEKINELDAILRDSHFVIHALLSNELISTLESSLPPTVRFLKSTKSETEHKDLNLQKDRLKISPQEAEAIRGLAMDGYTPAQIYEELYAETSVTRAQIAAICAWNKIYAKRNSNNSD